MYLKQILQANHQLCHHQTNQVMESKTIQVSKQQQVAQILRTIIIE